MRFAGYGRVSSCRQKSKPEEKKVCKITVAVGASGWVIAPEKTDNSMSHSMIYEHTDVGSAFRRFLTSQ